MKRIPVNAGELNNLQGKINMYLNSITERGVALSGQAHSDSCVSIIISVSGIRGVVQRTLVLIKTEQVVTKDGITGAVWHGYMNGVGYELATLTELKNLIGIQTRMMRSLALQR